jgi:hypothetical protein
MLLLKNICNNRKYSNKRKRKEVVEPLTNYNVLVLDQRLDKTHLYHLSTQTQEMEL